MGSLGRVLFAEDSQNDAELTLAALGESHLANEVIRVENGAEALDYLHRRGRFTERSKDLPAVILLDIKMPKVDGLEVLRQIRSDPNLAFLPVVMLTSSREERDIVESYRLGVNAYVVKPVDFPSFMEAIKHLGLFWAVVNEPPPAGLKAA